MKVNYSLSLKLTLVVVLLSTGIIFALSYINLQDLTSNEQRITDKISRSSVSNFANSHSLLKELEKNITSDKLNDTEELNSYLLNLIKEKNNSNVLKISIYTLNENGLLIVNASTDLASIQANASEYNYNSSKYGHTFYIIDEKEPILTIISPINISGKIVGTSEVIIFMGSTSSSNEAYIKYVFLMAAVSIFTLIFSLLILLRKIIVKPIVTFRDSTRSIGKGNLETKVEIKSNDELGELADSFNQMTKDLKDSRDKIEDYNRILEGLLKQKDEFIGQLGHDLKNPLTPLVGLLPIIKEKEQDPEIREHLEIINTNVEYMSELIFNTLKLAKLRSSNVQFDIEKLNLTVETKKVIETQKLLLKQHNIQIENKIVDDIFIQADRLRLTELFQNLITNSVKYSKKDGGKITIDAVKDKEFVKVSIKDTGIGMTQEQQERIFNEFYKADKFSSETHSSGLGLAICKRIVEKHGGRIWAESPGLDQGSTFYFTLKLFNEK